MTIHSMTAFASAQAELEKTTFCWELKSVNNRYLDISFRLPEACRFLEGELRLLARKHIQRGKLECLLKFSSDTFASQAVCVNQSLLSQLLTISNDLACSYQLPHDLSVSSVMNFPGVLQFLSPNTEQWQPSLLALFVEALTQLQAVREREGQGLKTVIQQRLTLLEDEIHKARTIVANMALETKEKLQNRLNLVQINVDKGRLEQEIGLILIKLDVTEELDRLALHTKEFAQIITKCQEPVGRRLDFLLQELNREANTLSAKSDTSVLTQCAVEMKVLIEQMREQIQNIE